MLTPTRRRTRLTCSAKPSRSCCMGCCRAERRI